MGECIEEMKKLKTNSIDLVLTDPPYGTTTCKWDNVIDPVLMWEQLKRITKKNGAIVMTASQPFTSTLVMSNIKQFKQAMVWSKGKGTTPLLAKKRPMQSHEDILVFCYGSLPYNPQMKEGKPYKPAGSAIRGCHIIGSEKEMNEGFVQEENFGTRYPLSVVDFYVNCGTKQHPTQKPVELME
jgi:site-specific DNA-methyltransferase (adenine-specific)